MLSPLFWPIALLSSCATSGPAPTTAPLELGLPQRTEAQRCEPRTSTPEDPACANILDGCTESSQCSGGLCVLGYYSTDCTCISDTCVQDSDCQEGAACACAGDPIYGSLPTSHCTMGGGCLSNADCASGLCLGEHTGWCWPPYQQEPVTAWRCASPGDTCRSDEACPEGERCIYDHAQGHFACSWEWGCMGD